MKSSEILLRGKTTKTGVWVYGTGITDFLNIYPDKKGLWMWSNYSWVEVVPETVGQYIGRKDKVGVKIFDGDLLDFEEREWGGKFTPEEITIEKLINEEICGSLGDISEWRTVIGNIHEK